MLTHGSKKEKGAADKRRSFIDKSIKDRDGRVALWLTPNLPLTIWIVARVLMWPLSGTDEKAAWVVAVAALFIWTVLELLQGVNYFRRALGLVVLILTVTSALHGLL